MTDDKLVARVISRAFCETETPSTYCRQGRVSDTTEFSSLSHYV